MIPDGDVAVMNRALTTLLAELSKRKFAATDRPRPGRARSAEARDPAAEVRRAVWKRDGGRCGFVSKDGRRCTARGQLEYQIVEMTEPSFSSRKPTGSGASKTYNADQLPPALPATPKGASTRLSNSRNLSLWGGGT